MSSNSTNFVIDGINRQTNLKGKKQFVTVT